MKLLLLTLITLSQSLFAISPDNLRLINKKMGAIAYQPSDEVVIRKLTDNSAFAKAGILEGDIILEVNDGIVFGLDHFFKQIANAEEVTPILVERENQLLLFNPDLGEAIPLDPDQGSGETPAYQSLSGSWTSGYESKFYVSNQNGSCLHGNRYESYSFKSYYPNGIVSYGTIVRTCRNGRLKITSDRYGFSVKGQLKNMQYMIWSQVPILSQKYDFHIWR